eukprot:Blabericola_migrator_1__3753@NODE_2124_length_3236_cov_538_062165_g1346_i0_p2_GENE_NODE_2124_length_3236_cov_538_062165_g1346_i0NODE_2124_length_3236_cov_538_062165_g1346_i0_p2_ORF_typecomplete_len215_score27_98TMEM174/PF15029_6/1_7TMEM174/PF15029_6/1_8e03_NODE_2124_length_3236_cov_538_062165_g1346_i013281972
MATITAAPQMTTVPMGYSVSPTTGVTSSTQSHVYGTTTYPIQVTNASTSQPITTPTTVQQQSSLAPSTLAPSTVQVTSMPSASYTMPATSGPIMTSLPAGMSLPIGTTSMPLGSPTVMSSYPHPSSSTVTQIYHPENTEYVLPNRGLRGGMRPLYDMHQVRTYEAAPVFQAAPSHIAHETVIHRGEEEAPIVDEPTHKKRHTPKNKQTKKKMCC